MKKFYERFCLFVTALLLAVTVRAQAPEYVGGAFDSMQETADDATLFFGVVVVLSILVTGFLLGRRWLRRV